MLESPTLYETITETAKIMTEITKTSIICMWKIAGLVDAEETDNKEVTEIFRVHRQMRLNEDSELRRIEEAEPVVQEISDQSQLSNQITSLNINSQEKKTAVKLKQTNITAFLSENK